MTSLRARLGFAIAAAVLAAIALTLLCAALLVDRSLNKAALRGLSQQAALLAQRTLRPRTGPFGVFLATQDERVAVVSRSQAALLLPSAEDASRPTTGSLTLHTTHYLFASHPSGNETIVMLRSEHSVAADHRSFLYAFGAAAGLGAVLAALVASLLARGIARPVGRVADASRHLAAGGTLVALPEAGSDELRTLARAFNEMALQLSQARDSERSFLVSISHELRTPLTAIRGFAEALHDGVLSPVRAGEVIEAEARRLERLVVDLLELARLNRLGFDVERQPLDLAAVARETVDRHERRARELGVALEYETAGDTQALGDHDRLLQAVSNLVENALRCTPSGGRVDVHANPGEIAVADTGPGIASEDLPHAFDRFFLYRRYGAERPVGTGLGLALVRELAQAMGGDVTVESELGRGTTFRISIAA
ncbi:MAG TPA: HAMP domain-containing sensor histidine kinase [Gaiellaceae bacterium]|nr:HAMP domain-containing sensor histidine kinase [Gaiellaceae bacterium]